MLAILKNRYLIIASILLCTQTAVYYSLSAKEIIPEIAPWNRFPQEIGEWQTTLDVPMEPAVFNTLKPDDYLDRVYVSENSHQAVSLFVAYFNSRRNGRAPHSPEWCLPGAGWQTVSTRVVAIPGVQGDQPLPANEYIVKKQEGQDIVLYWYHQSGRAFASDLAAQFYSLPDMVLHRRTDITLVRIIAPVVGDTMDEERGVSYGFASKVYPLIQQYIQ